MQNAVKILISLGEFGRGEKMSQVEVHVGRLCKVDRVKTEPIENWCKEYCQQNGLEHLEGFYDTWEECFRETQYEKYIIVNNNIYHIVEDREFTDCGDIFEAHENELGQIDYCLSYYNGGCGLSEAIEHALENMKTDRV